MKNDLLIDAAFPGGNIAVEKVLGDDVYLRQELRDTAGHWYYWYFRVRGAAGRRLNFRFIGGKVIGVRGPAVSHDGGWTWNWLGAESSTREQFAHAFANDENDVRFSFGMPYLEEHLHRFLSRCADDPRVRVEELCVTPAGRRAERLRVGCVDAEPDVRVTFTARHHACEMMANYAMEGIVEEALGDSDAGRWLSRHVEMLLVPFVDKDGVEAGDQGKNRVPHDHGLDYAGESLYPTTAAIRRLLPEWSAAKLSFVLDLHCPGPWGEFHEVLMSPSRLRGEENWTRTERYLECLERVQTGPIVFRLTDSQRFTTWDGSGKPGAAPGLFSEWAREIPGVKIASSLEIPYANSDGCEVNRASACALGHDLARALAAYLREDA